MSLASRHGRILRQTVFVSKVGPRTASCRKTSNLATRFLDVSRLACLPDRFLRHVDREQLACRAGRFSERSIGPLDALVHRQDFALALAGGLDEPELRVEPNRWGVVAIDEQPDRLRLRARLRLRDQKPA
jgi:hypothetical protein